MKNKVKFSLMLILICMAISLQAKELKEYKLTGTNFIFRGKELKMGETFTKKSFEQKFGKSDGSEEYPGGFYLVYKKEKMILSFTTKNEFKGIVFNFANYKKINLQGLVLNKSDTYRTIRKKLEKAKLYFSVIETVSQNRNQIRIEIDFPDYLQTKKIVATISFSEDVKQQAESLFYLYENDF